ncbi:Rap1a/Tai family immunity protein [Roseomonas sp. WA12]
MSGHQIYEGCTTTHLAAFCRGYVLAVTQVITEPNGYQGWRACIPQGVPPQQLEAVVREALVRNPQQRSLPAFDLVANAVAVAFQCPRSRR